VPAMHMDAPCPNSGRSAIWSATGGFASDAESLGGRLSTLTAAPSFAAASIGLGATMAATNKRLARSNKTRAGVTATNRQGGQRGAR